MRSVLVVALTSLAACGLTPQSPMARVREAAQELALNARFGQNELAMQYVAPDARDTYAAHHRAWGSGVRVADVELGGLKSKGDHDIDVLVHVTWYRIEQEELLNTSVRQRWHDEGGWQLVSEERVDGEVGLLGEPVVFEAPPPGARAPARFPTLHLGDNAPAD